MEQQQQQLHQQREVIHEQERQHELLRQQQQGQQEAIQRQQQMQGQYRQQLEVQQHQSQQQRQPPQYRLHYNQDQLPMPTEQDHGMVTSSAHPAALSILTLPPNIHLPYQQRPHHYRPMHHPDTTGGLSSYALPPLAGRGTQRAQQPMCYSTLAQQPQQHFMHTAPPEYSSSDSGPSHISSTSTYLPPTPISATPSPSSHIPYWSAASNSFAMPDQ